MASLSRRQLGVSIARARRQAGLTQAELSERAGLAYSTLAKIERGAIKNPSIFTMYTLSQALGVSIEQLIGADSAESPRTQTKKSVKFVYCDMNGVMVRFYQRGFVTLAEEKELNPDVVESTFWHYNDAANRGEMSLAEFNKTLAKHLHVDSVDWMKHYMAAVEPIPVMHECLRDLKKHNVRIGLLTNTMPGFVEHMLEKGILPKLDYDVIVDSSEVGYIKPEPKMYELAEGKAGFRGSEILFVDDSRTNLTAAEKRGWRVLWFDDYRPEESAERIKRALGA